MARRPYAWGDRRSGFRRRVGLNLIISLLVLAFAVVYAGVPSAERTTVGAEPVNKARTAIGNTGLVAAIWTALESSASQPLDLVACPWLGFGCRFLRLDHRTLLANSPPADVLVRLRTGTSDDLEKDLAHVEGLFLRSRTLRFADFTESRLYAAILMEADLQGAVFYGAQLQTAALRGAKLQGADLIWAQLQGAFLARAG